jgi:hypothetical protein
MPGVLRAHAAVTHVRAEVQAPPYPKDSDAFVTQEVLLVELLGAEPTLEIQTLHEVPSELTRIPLEARVLSRVLYQLGLQGDLLHARQSLGNRAVALGSLRLLQK